MMINERLYWKAVQYAEWRCHKDETLLMPKVLLGEYNRLLKIEDALQGLTDQAQQLNLGYGNKMTMKLIKVGEFEFIEHTDNEGDKLLVGGAYYNDEQGEYLFEPRGDLIAHYDAADLRGIAEILANKNEGG